MRRTKQVYYRESSDEDEREVANLTDSNEEDKNASEDEADYIPQQIIEEDLLNPDISQILTWRTEKAATSASDTCTFQVFNTSHIDNVEECEFLVKFKNYSYHNLEWMTYGGLNSYNKRAAMKLKRFVQTHQRK